MRSGDERRTRRLVDIGARLARHPKALRGRIEEYHKAWKSGVGVEKLRHQSPANLERMLVSTAMLAVRLLQLREQLPPQRATGRADVPCRAIA